VDDKIWFIRPVTSRWVSDDPFPGWVEVDFEDSLGRICTVADKPSVFASSAWSAEPGAPDDVGIGCRVINESGERTTVQLAWGLESRGGEREFVVSSDALFD